MIRHFLKPREYFQMKTKEWRPAIFAEWPDNHFMVNGRWASAIIRRWLFLTIAFPTILFQFFGNKASTGVVMGCGNLYFQDTRWLMKIRVSCSQTLYSLLKLIPSGISSGWGDSPIRHAPSRRFFSIDRILPHEPSGRFSGATLHDQETEATKGLAGRQTAN